jgi:hypothetical protein
MATADDIDTKAAVSKFLQRQTITPSADGQANTADEIQAILETIATTFLLYPQAVLPLILRAKNSFRQVVQVDLEAVEFILKALLDINNPDRKISNSSDLVEAQTALVELDRLGRVESDLQAFDRYKRAINRFLDEQLAPTLKRNGRKEFERTGTEAKEDIFSILPQFAAAHLTVAERLEELQKSISDFRSVDLIKLVSVTTISRVRSSLRRVRSRVDSGTISKTVAAIELLAGAASLTSIADTGDVFNPTVDTGEFPARTSIQARAEQVSATVLSSEGPWVVGPSPWLMVGTIDPLEGGGTPFNFEIPATGASGRVYVYSETDDFLFDIPANGTLYLHLEGAAVTEYEIALTSGSGVPLATLISDINTALGSDGSCVQNPLVNGFVIYGSGSVNKIVVRTGSSGAAGTYNTDPSAHDLLGFSSNQTSEPIGRFTAQSLADAIRSRLSGLTVTVEGDRVRLTSDSEAIESSIFLDNTATNAVQGSFGFANGITESEPSYIELVDGTTVQDLTDLGVFIDSVVTSAEVPAISGSDVRTLNNEPIVDIRGTQISFADGIHIPRGTQDVVISSPVVATVQALVASLAPFVGTFDEDVDKLQRVLAPIISKPTRAQTGDARRALEDVQTRLETLLALLDSYTARADRSEFDGVAEQVMSVLEERGMDRAQELLATGRFSQFFSLSKETSSKSSRLLKAMEDVARQDLPVSITEVDIDDDQHEAGENPDTSVLTGFELEDDGPLATDD